MRLFQPGWAFAFLACLCACGGGGGSTPSVSAGTSTIVTPAPTATPTLPATSSAVVAAGASTQTAGLATIAGGYGGAVTFPVTTAGSGSASLGLAAGNAATVTASRRLPKAIGGSLDPLVYVTLTASANLTFAAFPAFTFTLPASIALPAGASLYLAYDPGDVAGGWSTLAGPAALSGNAVTFPGALGPVTFASGTTYAFALIAMAQVLVVATPSPAPSASAPASPSPSPSSSASANVAFTCPATGTASFARIGGSSGEATRRTARAASAVSAPGTTMLAVTYARATAAGAAAHIADRERALQASFLRTYDYPREGVTIRVVAVPSAAAAQTQSAFRAEPGVQTVGVTGGRRFASRVTTPYYTDDPYFQGFAPNSETLPYAESASVPGQWDMHAIGLGYAFGYSLAGNGSGLPANANALGSANVKIAIIDTGEDANHPELNNQIAYQHCYITNLSGVQSTGSFSTDEDGHGTDVSGIAASQPNNNLGFTGAGGAAKIYGYRVFPTPDDSCVSGQADDTCSSDTNDIASAIDDAVTQDVNVISMSLGGGSCTSGTDDDPVEGAAVRSAIDAGIIVVAASGNSGASTPSVTAPACNTGVIAVGATSLDDGALTGTSGHYTSTLAGAASSVNPVEYVARYSQYGSPPAAAHRASAWGIVAPGGDPGGGSDNDDLHWIENIWTTTPYGGQSDLNFAGECTGDYNNANGTIDCRTLIAGTSMATPHVSGAVALILAVAPSYQSPAAMKALLCSTADDLSDSHQGCGRLNVYHAMATALGDTAFP